MWFILGIPTITKLWPFAEWFSLCISKWCDSMYYSDCVILSFDSSNKLSKSFKCWQEEIRGTMVFFQEFFHLIEINIILPFNILEI